MKRTIIALWALFICHLAMAEVVTESQARRRAADFFAAAEVGPKVKAVRPDDFTILATFPEAATRSSSSEPLIYVFQRESGGYAIMSGDDVARPVLGYSLDGRFPVSEMPDGMRDMLQWYADIIEFARQRGWASSSKAFAPELNPDYTVRLETANWDQWDPFNRLAPEIDGQKPPIGCVATAIAIIMRYHEWPSNGTGTLPAYDYWDRMHQQYVHVEGIELGHTYEWDKMPLHYRYCSEEEAAQMARLLYDVAVMCNMSFSPSGSGSLISYARRLIDYFDYDRLMRYMSRSLYKTAIWEQTIKDEIDAGRPVLYSGEAGVEGHAFVVDGYNGSYFCINYGWTHSHGFYTLTPIEGHEEDLNAFNDDQSMVCCIMPNSGGEPNYELYIGGGITWLSPRFTRGESFPLWTKVRNESIVYDSEHPLTRNVRCALFDRNGQLKEMISPVESAGFPNNYSSDNFTCRITTALSDGDRIAVIVEDPKTGEWKPLRAAKRCGEIIFTSKPLSELLEIGYVEPDPSLNGAYDIYVKFYKDICWRIFKKENMQPLNEYGNFGYQPFATIGGVYDSDGVAVDLEDPDDFDCDTAIIRLRLPSCEALLRATNPVTGEVMEITLEL